MTASQVLQEARALIEAGWCQGAEVRYRDVYDNKEYCITGAIQASGGSCSVREAVIEALTRHLPRNEASLMCFNDHPRTTKRRVLALFDRALVKVTK